VHKALDVPRLFVQLCLALAAKRFINELSIHGQSSGHSRCARLWSRPLILDSSFSVAIGFLTFPLILFPPQTKFSCYVNSSAPAPPLPLRCSVKSPPLPVLDLLSSNGPYLYSVVVRGRVLTWPYPGIHCTEVYLITSTTGEHALASFM
jgi:hypothetical protein